MEQRAGRGSGFAAGAILSLLDPVLHTRAMASGRKRRHSSDPGRGSGEESDSQLTSDGRPMLNYCRVSPTRHPDSPGVIMNLLGGASLSSDGSCEIRAAEHLARAVVGKRGGWMNGEPDAVRTFDPHAVRQLVARILLTVS